ncbi:MAG TPA: TonB-dependent receptor [Puia sp.]|nr:TonB-dependent receptor [Puia sp.]
MPCTACRSPLSRSWGRLSNSLLRSKPIFTLLIFLVLSIASFAHDFQVKVTLVQNNVTLDKIFAEITRQTGYTFVYTDVLIQKANRVSVNVHNVSLEQALDSCFAGQTLSWSIVDKMIVVGEKPVTAGQVKATMAAEAPRVTERPLFEIRGRITGHNGEPLGGVSISEKGTNNAVVSEEDGSFRIRVDKPNAVLVISYVGYETKEVNVAGQTVLNLSLLPTNTGMNEVVVIGYGTAKRKDLTGSVVSVGSKDIKDLGLTRVDQALLGKAPGVQVKPVSGEPGASPQILIRGVGSISASPGPLFVVDGFPVGNIETLNPNDIESIDILKDASATAIYGSRGSGGVIIINTRRGKAGKPVFTFDAYGGSQKVSREPKMMNARQQAQYFYDGIKNRNLDVGHDVTGPPTSWINPVPQIILDVLSGANKTDQNALNAVLVTAPISEYQVTASGGTENIKYYVSGEYLDQQGIVLNSYFKRYGLRANIDAKLTPRLSIRLNINPAFNTKSALPETGNQGENPLGSAISVSNFYPLVDASGNYTVFGGLAAQADFWNPLAVSRLYVANQKQMRFLGSLEANYQITDDLRFRVLVGGTTLSNHANTFKPQLPVFFNNPPTGTDSTSNIYNWLTEYTLTYDKKFGDHHITAFGGFTAQQERGETNSLTSNKFPNNLVTTLSAASGLITNGTSLAYQWSLESWLGRINYDYNSKYYFTASIRTDGSSRFGKNNKYGVFPSAAVAWRVSEEKFLKSLDFLSEWKLRASYGQTGNNNIGDYDQYATINYNKYPLGGVAASGFGPGTLADPSLSWEKQRSFNLGTDVGLFNNRIRVSVDHFESKNYDLLLNVNVPDVTGFSTSLTNIGEVRNTGWEFVVSSVNMKGKFGWTTDVNLSTFRNKVMRLGPQGDPIFVGNNETLIGHPMGMFYGLLTDGIFKTQAELAKGPIFDPGAADHSRVGDIRFRDVSGPNGKPDGVINSFDYTLMGNPYPNFYYGMTNRFNYGDFSLSVSLQGTQGNKIYNNSRGAGNSTRARVRVYAFNNNYWKSEQDPGDGQTPRPNDAPSGGVRLPSQRWLDDGSYLRISDITLAYVLPARLVNRAKIRSIRVYASVTNAFMFTHYTTYNPDVSTSGNPLQPGNESNDYPLPRTIMGGLNIGF